jgi:hypothetical protein
MDWLDEELGEFENDYLIIDCPGMPASPKSKYTRKLMLDRTV